MNTRSQMMCLWCGPIAILIWLVGFGFCAGFLPPLSPASSAAEITAYYNDHSVLVRLGLILTMFGGSVTGPWVAVTLGKDPRLLGARPPKTPPLPPEACGPPKTTSHGSI